MAYDYDKTRTLAVQLTTYNSLELLKAAVESVYAQDCQAIDHVYLEITNNGSTDATMNWLNSYDVADGDDALVVSNQLVNQSPVKLANNALWRLFSQEGFSEVLMMPNDVVLPTDFVGHLRSWPRGVVTASMSGEMPTGELTYGVQAISENTPMAVVLWRKWCYDAVVAEYGYFLDEGFWFYGSDCDLALRMAALGIRGVQLDLPYWHYGSASWKTAPETEKQMMLIQADVDREYFEKKWNFRVDDPEYSRLAADLNFKGRRIG